MVQEFEHLRNNLIGIGKPRIAREVNAVLKKYLSELPPTFPNVPKKAFSPSLSTFRYLGGDWPITQGVLDSSLYTGELLQTILPFGLQEGQHKKMVKQTYNSLALGFLLRDQSSNPPKNLWKYSLSEIMMLSDRELLEEAVHFGRISLGIFRRATQRTIETLN